jgi:hypothetical protein
VHRRDGRVLRRTTVYLPAELAAKLRVYCATRDVLVSEVLAELVERLFVSGRERLDGRTPRRRDRPVPKRNRRRRNARPATAASSAPRVVRCRPESQAAWEAGERGEVLPLTRGELYEALESGELPEHAQRWLDSRK